MGLARPIHALILCAAFGFIGRSRDGYHRLKG